MFGFLLTERLLGRSKKEPVIGGDQKLDVNQPSVSSSSSYSSTGTSVNEAKSRGIGSTLDAVQAGATSATTMLDEIKRKTLPLIEVLVLLVILYMVIIIIKKIFGKSQPTLQCAPCQVQ